MRLTTSLSQLRMQTVMSPDGGLAAASRAGHDSYERPGDVTLSSPRWTAVTPARRTTCWPVLTAARWRRPGRPTPRRSTSPPMTTAGARSSGPNLATGEVTRVTTDNGAYDNVCPAPDGRTLYALRAAIDEPPAPVRIDLAAPGGEPTALAAPGGPTEVPGRLEEVQTTAADGAAIRAWLVLPDWRPGPSATGTIRRTCTRATSSPRC